ncbi:hypothetical protein [Frankia sp. R82]|uniref:hypothetical protein n=1 Tax=Frankia sp. R82 TaxID=2950553 RepID=UPI0020447D86|nr:hypothetical protein [Frankia sp. R82]MCM3882612.1 hypothetical protein [Frankia sp. R82]
MNAGSPRYDTATNTVVDALESGDLVRVAPNVSGVAICLGDGTDTIDANPGADTCLNVENAVNCEFVVKRTSTTRGYEAAIM